MKISTVVLVLVIACLACAQAKNAPFSLAITGPESVKSGSELRINVRLANISNHDLTVFERNKNCDYQVQVLDQQHRPASQTAERRNLSCDTSIVNANVLVTLKPGEARDVEILVTALYEMNNAGDYIIWVTRKIPPDLGDGIVKSNNIIVKVR